MKSNSFRARRILKSSFVALAFTTLLSAISWALPYTFSTLAGSNSSSLYGSIDGAGTAARFGYAIAGVVKDGSGNTYVADYSNFTIRKISASGVVTTLAGQAGSQGNVDGPIASARFNAPFGIVIDSQGNIFVSESWARRIRKITPSGTVSTFVGPGAGGYLDANGTSAGFGDIRGLAIDSADNIYACDTGYNTIRKIAPNGDVTLFAGAGAAGTQGTTNGTGSAARFNAPRSLTVDGVGNVYVLDTGNHSIRKITPSGVVTTLAGYSGSSGSADGSGSAARFNLPFGIWSDAFGNIMVADTYNSTIRSVTSAGSVTTVAGLAGSYSFANGTGSTARFSAPMGIYQTAARALTVTDTGNNTVRTGTESASTQMPVITSALTTTVPVNTAFSYFITATNGPISYYNATGLPSGLSINHTTGEISGTPTAIGTSFVTISAVNSYGTGGLTLTISVAGPPPVITSASSVNVVLGDVLTYQIGATNSPISYDFSGVPPGNGSYSQSTGLLSLTTTIPGTYSMSVYATNTGGTGSRTVQVNVAMPGNNIQWTPGSIAMPSSAAAGDTVTLATTVKNTGSTTWGSDYFVRLLDADGIVLGYCSLSGTTPGSSAAVTFTFPAQKSGGVRLTAFQQNVAYFGETITAPLTITGWWWGNPVDSNGYIRLKSMYNSTEMFDLQLGAGGAIIRITCTPQGKQIMADWTLAGEQTDRVLQWVFWNKNLVVDPSPNAKDGAFNENQAGSGPDSGGPGVGEEHYAPIINVVRSATSVDIYSVPNDHYNYILKDYFLAKFPCLTRYELLPDGVLKIRRVILFGSIWTPAATLANHSHFYLESWTPFLGGLRGMNAYTTTIGTSGAPSQTYDWAYIVGANDGENTGHHMYQGTQVTGTSGYAMGFQNGSYATSPVAGVVFGTSEYSFSPSSTHTVAPAGSNIFNVFAWGGFDPIGTGDMGLCLMPAIELTNVPTGSVIDTTMHLVLRGSSDSSLKGLLEAKAAANPGPVLYAPNYSFSGELNTIVTALKANESAVGTRTPYLGTLSN